MGQMGYGMTKDTRLKMSKEATMFVVDLNTKTCNQFLDETRDYGPVEIVSSAKMVLRGPALCYPLSLSRSL